MLTKLCKQCKKQLIRDAFRPRGSICRACLHRNVRNHPGHKQCMLRATRRRRARRYFALQAKAVARLGGRCQNPDCPLPDHGAGMLPCVFDFHHRDPTTKLANVSTLISNSRRNAIAEATIMTEVDKCDLLCCVCHRVLHFQAQHSAIPKAMSIGDANRARNKIVIEHAGKQQTVSAWLRELGLHRSVYYYRRKRGKSPLEALGLAPN
jgi:hypothetical protein